MAYDYSKLLGKITEVYRTQERFATAIGMSVRTLSLKLNNKVSFKQPEISLALNLLGISNSEVSTYFFTPKVQ